LGSRSDKWAVSGYTRVITAAVEAGIVVVVAAGNDNIDSCSHSPAFAAAAITVGATTSRNKRAHYSNYGSCNQIMAPGSAIESADFNSNTGTRTISGTSMACPHVSGAAALLLQVNPSLTSPQILTSMLATARTGLISDLNANDPREFLSVRAAAYVGLSHFTIRPQVQPQSCFNSWGGRLVQGEKIKFGLVCGTGSNTQFVYNSGDYTIRVIAKPELCLNANTGKLNSGDDIQLWRCSAARNEQFVFFSDNTIRLKSKTHLCLNVRSGYLQSGRQIQLYRCHTEIPGGAAPELWVRTSLTAPAPTPRRRAPRPQPPRRRAPLRRRRSSDWWCDEDYGDHHC